MTQEFVPITISGTGSYAPKRILTNAELAESVDTSEEWILTRTGIRERKIATEGEMTSDMAAEAARRSLEAAGIAREEIDLIIVATTTPDMPFPSTACLVQHKLGLKSLAAFDLQAACSGFLYALETGAGMVRSGAYRNALVIGAERLSSIVDWQDRSTCVLFGDGAGAVVVGRNHDLKSGWLGAKLGCDGSAVELLHLPGGGCQIPASCDSIEGRQHFIKMKGREVFKAAVRVMEQSALQLLEHHGLTADQVGCVVPHQANLRIIETLASRLRIPMERFFLNLDRYGNTSAASIPIALDEAVRGGRIKSRDLVLMVAFGGGLTWGSSLIRWP
jgi:3-oxoacyl-[acyl-carrier-protein] synthase-3